VLLEKCPACNIDVSIARRAVALRATMGSSEQVTEPITLFPAAKEAPPSSLEDRQFFQMLLADHDLSAAKMCSLYAENRTPV
jgi:hypothetical protein